MNHQTLVPADPVPVLGTDLAVLLFGTAPITEWNPDGSPVLPVPWGATPEDLSRAEAEGWSVVTILMAAHLVAIMVWAITYDMVGIVPDRQDTFYFAFANYTTLGYGDIIPIKRWRLLGPMTAMNGMLLFGWSAAVIFDVLRAIARVTPEPSSTPE